MKLKTTLQAQRRGLAELLQLLDHEQRALLDANVDGERLQALAASKQDLLVRLAELDSHRSAAGLKPTAVEAAIRRAGCVDEWQAIEDLARRCSYLNQLNGSLLHQRLQHNQRVLRSLRQLAGNPLYGADGQTHKGRGRIQTSA